MPQLSRSQIVAYAAIVLAVLVLGGRWLAGRASGQAGTDSGGWTTASPAPEVQRAPARAGADEAPEVEQPNGRTFVHVVGAVRRPGVYRLADHARVQDAIERAGGATGRADVGAINLAALVQDGVQIVVPRRGGAGAPAVAAAGVAAAASGEAAVPAAPINLNTATAEQLETLDGVGPATAAKIIEYRTSHGGFRSVEDLDEVSGIGEKRLEALRDKVTV
jgi:competence protein ComEA